LGSSGDAVDEDDDDADAVVEKIGTKEETPWNPRKSKTRTGEVSGSIMIFISWGR
jgi:hypothetical protein